MDRHRREELWRTLAVLPIIIAPWVYGWFVLYGHLKLGLWVLILVVANGIFCLYMRDKVHG